MRTNIKPENRRLLEAVEYIDENIILGVLSELRMPKEKHIEPLLTWRTPLKHWKSIAVLAACTVLLAFAAPTASFISQVISNYSSVAGGNAGAGTAESEVIDSGFDKALERYADMSADEIYADVLKGGWVVKGPGYLGDLEAGKDLLDNFFIKTQNGEPATVLYANYYTVNGNAIYLYEVVYNGDKFYFNLFNCQTDVIDFQGEYEYLKKGIVEYTELGELYVKEGYFLTNRDSVTWDMLYNSHLNAWYAPEYERSNDINYVIIEIVNKK